MSAISAHILPTASVEQTGPTHTLAQLQRGDQGRISSVEVGTSDLSRLKALGLCMGRNVRVVSSGNPLIVSVLGARVGLSHSLARQVNVQLH